MAAKKKEEEKKTEEAPSGGGGSKLTLILLVLMVVNLGATGFTAFMSLNPVPAPAPEKNEEPADPTGVIPVGPLIELEPFLVNLNETDSSRYLRMKLRVEVADQPIADRFDRAMPVLRSELLAYLSSLSVKDTLGFEAKEAITTNVLEKLNERLGPHSARRIFIEEFVVQ